MMANLIVRNIDDEVAKALKALSRKHGISAEEEHRRILRQALMQPRKRSFSEVLSEMPDVGEDVDFERVENEPAGDVFD